MTVQESINAALAQSNRYQKVDKFSKAFRTDDLGNIEAGEEFTIPSGKDYVILSQRVMRGGAPVLDREGNEVTAEFIKCMSSKGRVVNFYPSSLTKVAFAVDPETGKDLTENRIRRTTGDIVDYVKAHPDMDATMRALQGCTIKCSGLESVSIREFGISNDDATKENVQKTNVGTWNLVGDKKPANWGK